MFALCRYTGLCRTIDFTCNPRRVPPCLARSRYRIARYRLDKGLDTKMAIQVKLDPLAMAAVLDILGNIVVMLELRKDPMEVAQQIREFIAKHTEEEAVS